LFSSVKFDQVIHLAARAGVRPSLTPPGGVSDKFSGGNFQALETTGDFASGGGGFGGASLQWFTRPSRTDPTSERMITCRLAARLLYRPL
jgi:hypothetical protein